MSLERRLGALEARARAAGLGRCRSCRGRPAYRVEYIGSVPDDPDRPAAGAEEPCRRCGSEPDIIRLSTSMPNSERKGSNDEG
jgi:hypothetical protein